MGILLKGLRQDNIQGPMMVNGFLPWRR